jgi:hypothetical protein
MLQYITELFEKFLGQKPQKLVIELLSDPDSLACSGRDLPIHLSTPAYPVRIADQYNIPSLKARFRTDSSLESTQIPIVKGMPSSSETRNQFARRYKGKADRNIPAPDQQQQVRQSKQHSHVSPQSQQQNIVAKLPIVSYRHR